MQDAQLIDSPAALTSFAARAHGAPWLGVDTEFVRDRHYFPRAGLLQIATPDTVALVDPVALPGLAALGELLCNPASVKILHAARQDLELLLLLFERVPAPLFDTQVAAAMAGLAPQIGYGTLVTDLLEAQLPPALGRYDWLRRPIADTALEYAAEDVRHLHTLRSVLEKRVDAQGRSADFAAAMAAAADPARYRPDPASAWRRVRMARRLQGAALARFRTLAEWRERRAMSEDRPRQWVLRDGALVAIARIAPRSSAGFSAIEGLSPAWRRRYVPEILALLREPPRADGNPFEDEP